MGGFAGRCFLGCIGTKGTKATRWVVPGMAWWEVGSRNLPQGGSERRQSLGLGLEGQNAVAS